MGGRRLSHRAAVAVACGSFSDDATTPNNAGPVVDAMPTPPGGDDAGPAEARIPDAGGEDVAAGVAITPYVAAVMADASVAYWRMSTPPEDKPTIQNVVPGGPAITAQNQVTLAADSTATPSDTDGATQFDGSEWYAPPDATDYQFDAPADFTIEFWANAWSCAPCSILGDAVTSDTDQVNGYIIGLSTNNHVTLRYGSGTTETTIQGPPASRPACHGYAIAVKGWTSVSFYVDGAIQTTDVLTTTGAPITPAGTFTIGSLPAFDDDAPYTGALDEVAIYDHVLTQDRLLAHVNAAAAKAH